MARSTIRSCIDTLTEPFGLFRSLCGFEVERDVFGDVALVAGGNSVVFKIRLDGTCYALKCHTVNIPHAHEVSLYVNAINSPLLCKTTFLPEEMFLYDSSSLGHYADVELTEWLEGHTLEFEIRRAAHTNDTARMALLCRTFDRLAAELLACQWAHGDIKPENIIVSPQGTMRLIDYDALYSPTIPPRTEAGTVGYRHPLRDSTLYDKHVDDYPLALISLSLHALVADISLHAQYNRKENIILSPDEIANGTSECFGHLERLFAGDAALSALCGALRSPTPEIKGIERIINRLIS